MKTPFDSALRVQRRAMDEIRVGLRAENDTLSTVAAARTALEARLSQESEVAANDFSIVSFAFADRLRAQRRGLDADRVRVGKRLDAMRDVALAASGQLRAIEVAAETYGDDLMRRYNGLEQAESDDRAGTRLAGGLQRKRSATASAWQ